MYTAFPVLRKLLQVFSLSKVARSDSHYLTLPMEDDFGEHLQKRVRNLQKRKQRLDRYAELPGDQLNEDQVAALSHKDSVEAPLKELQDLVSAYHSSAEQRAAEIEKEIKKTRAEAQEFGRREGQKALGVVLRFLHVAAVKHQTPGVPSEELFAIAKLLEELYCGTDDALVYAEKLLAGSADPVVEGWPYLKLRDLSLSPPKSTVPEKTEEQKESSPVISFLQEDELAEDSTTSPELETVPEQKQQSSNKENGDKKHDEDFVPMRKKGRSGPGHTQEGPKRRNARKPKQAQQNSGK